MSDAVKLARETVQAVISGRADAGEGSAGAWSRHCAELDAALDALIREARAAVLEEAAEAAEREGLPFSATRLRDRAARERAVGCEVRLLARSTPPVRT